MNYFAILVAAVAAFLISWMWYGPIFGTQWTRMVGLDNPTPEQKARGMKRMPMSIAIQLIGTLVMAFVLARAVAIGGMAEHLSGVAAGIHFGFWNWIGFIAPVTVGMVLWEGRPWKYWAIVAGNWLVNLIVMGIILALWA